MKTKHSLTAIAALLVVLMLSASAYALNLRFNVMFTPKHPLCLYPRPVDDELGDGATHGGQ
jgi:hypothetical protein